MPAWVLKVLLSRATWAVAALLAVVGGLVWWGYDWASDKCEAEKVAAVARANEQAAQIAAQDAEVYEWVLAEKSKVGRVYRRIKDEIETTPLPDCNLPYRGRVLWNAANTGRFPEDSSNPGQSLRTPTAPHWGDLQSERPAAEPHGSDGAVHADVP